LGLAGEIGRDRDKAIDGLREERKKPDLKTKLPTQKTTTQPFERSEQTIHDRREPILYCSSATTGNASRRYRQAEPAPTMAGRSLAAFVPDLPPFNRGTQ
jgi:hypothetical protein